MQGFFKGHFRKGLPEVNKMRYVFFPFSSFASPHGGGGEKKKQTMRKRRNKHKEKQQQDQSNEIKAEKDKLTGIIRKP